MALFLFELRRLARSPFLWCTAALTLVVCTLWNRDFAFNVSAETVEISTVMLLPAAGTTYAACLATSRDQRYGMPATLEALPVRASGHTLAVLLAASTVAGAVAALVTVAYLLGRLAVSGPVAGRFDLFEALTGMAVAVFAAALGTAAGRWIPSLFAAPLTITFGACLQVTGNALWNYRPGGEWLAPVNLMIDLPVEAASRPSGWHLTYVAGLAVLLGAVALLKHGTSRGRIIAVIAALVVAVPSAAIATRSGGRITGSPELKADRCHDIRGVSYCAYQDYAAWIPEWAQTVQPVIDAAPHAVKGRVTKVRQSPSGSSDSERPTSQTVYAGTAWGEVFRRHLAGEVAALMVGLAPRRPSVGHRDEPSCDASGQARTVVGLWLMGQASPPGRLTLRTELGATVQARGSDVAYAERLLMTADAGERIRANWETLINPKTTIEQALPLLGLQRDQTPSSEGSELPKCA
ncbi:hypothetical protein ACQPYK_22455 [Streptosporangium sp. CA-135522]|uniref:hypothetical protein n=1 Tax=Streptosporangium sp. CA-135522 TaxID=3240072 RepID=UPI003D9151DF